MSNTEIRTVTRKRVIELKGWVDKCDSTWVRILSHKEDEIITKDDGTQIRLTPASYFLKFKCNQFDFSGIGYVKLEVELDYDIQKYGSYISINTGGWVRSAKYKHATSGAIVDVPKIQSATTPKEFTDEPNGENIKMEDIF